MVPVPDARFWAWLYEPGVTRSTTICLMSVVVCAHNETRKRQHSAEGREEQKAGERERAYVIGVAVAVLQVAVAVALAHTAVAIQFTTKHEDKQHESI
jgi:hypothetical protein